MITETLAYKEEHHHDSDPTDIFGFWIYIMSDCVLFATLFATFAVMHNNVFGGPALGTLVELHYVFAETVLLLASSFTYGMSILFMYKGQTNRTMLWLGATFLLGLSFVAMEINEFVHLVVEGHGPTSSGAMSAFFTLVGTHGLHVSIGLFWMAVVVFQVAKQKLTPTMQRRLTYLGLFWAFLDIVWIFVFTFVYLMGAI